MTQLLNLNGLREKRGKTIEIPIVGLLFGQAAKSPLSAQRVTLFNQGEQKVSPFLNFFLISP